MPNCVAFSLHFLKSRSIIGITVYCHWAGCRALASLMAQTRAGYRGSSANTPYIHTPANAATWLVILRKLAVVHLKWCTITGKMCLTLLFLTAANILIPINLQNIVDYKYFTATNFFFVNWTWNTKQTQYSDIAVTVTYGRINPFFGPAIKCILRFNAEYNTQS